MLGHIFDDNMYCAVAWETLNTFFQRYEMAENRVMFWHWLHKVTRRRQMLLLGTHSFSNFESSYCTADNQQPRDEENEATIANVVAVDVLRSAI